MFRLIAFISSVFQMCIFLERFCSAFVLENCLGQSRKRDLFAWLTAGQKYKVCLKIFFQRCKHRLNLKKVKMPTYPKSLQLYST